MEIGSIEDARYDEVGKSESAKRDTVGLIPKQERGEHEYTNHRLILLFWNCYEKLTVIGTSSQFQIHCYEYIYFTVNFWLHSTNITKILLFPSHCDVSIYVAYKRGQGRKVTFHLFSGPVEFGQ